MAKKQTLVVTLPDGTIVTRTTQRTYTHMIAAQTPGGAWISAGWCGTLALAQKALGKNWPGYPQRIVSVDGPRFAKGQSLLTEVLG